MKSTIVIPTYWRGPVSESAMCTLDSDYIYDHATPLDDEGTLGRALSSLQRLEGDHDFTVAVVASSTRQEIKQAVEIKVRNILAEFDYDFPIFLIGPDELVLWRRRLVENGLAEYDSLLSLDGYSNIGNMCLLAAILTEADVAVLFDDDQVYEDPEYLTKALEHIGSKYEGDFVGGITGYYKREGNGILLPEPGQNWERIWGKTETINRELASIVSGARLKKTHYAVGGNMIIHRELFHKIPFDPAIPRGEDIDYVLNSRFFGYDFFMDNELWIRHLPRPRCSPLWHQLRQDIVRFIRVKSKLVSQTGEPGYQIVSASELDPYPGHFLKENFHDLVLTASLDMASEYMAAGMEGEADECLTNIAISKAEARKEAHSWQDYIAFQRRWEEFVNILPTLGIWSSSSGMD